MNQYESFVHDNSENSDVRVQNLEIEHQNQSEKLISELSRNKKEIESLIMQLNLLKYQQASNSESQDHKIKSENMNLKRHVDELFNKLTEAERVSHQKDEALFGLTKELERFQNILNTYELTDTKFKTEIITLAQAKSDNEKQLLDFKNRHIEHDSDYKQINQRLFALQRENEILQNSIELAKKHEVRFMVSILIKLWLEKIGFRNLFY
jgi:chromosome segregation ATPase